MAAIVQCPSIQGCLVTIPASNILLLTLNRPELRNCIPLDTSVQIQKLWEWFDTEPSLQVAIITGTEGSFCAGADLKGIYHTVRWYSLLRCPNVLRQNGTGSMSKA